MVDRKGNLSLTKGLLYQLSYIGQKIMESHATVAQPFFFPGQPDQPAVLLIHGFSSGPSDVIELGEYLSKHGVTVSGPCLPGHGTTPDDLNSKRATDWNAAVISEYQRLRMLSRRSVAVIGYSFGGNLALTAAAEHTIQPSSLVTINMPLFLPHEYLHRFLIPVIMRLKKSVKKSWVKPAQRAQVSRLAFARASRHVSTGGSQPEGQLAHSGTDYGRSNSKRFQCAATKRSLSH